MPYVFGIAGVSGNDLSGVETGWGSDCSNFLIHAWRRNGIKLTWGDPGRLRAQLATVAENVNLRSEVPIKTEDVDRGLMIDFGRHVAAVWEDREPLGLLDGNDLVAHHLGGFPEVVTLAELTADRPVFSLRTPSEPAATCRIRVAGDVVLSGDRRWEAPGFEKGGAALFLANLEGVPSMRDPDVKPRYDFRFPPEALAWLGKRGVDIVSMANNHAGDAGRAGLMEGVAAVRAAGMAVVGVGKNAREACGPWRGTCGGVPVAVFGACLVDTLSATDTLPGVAKLPDHAGMLETRIREAVSAGDTVVIMVHGGDEYRATVNDEQRKWARKLVKWGADLIVGAHPHVVQRGERHGGALIAHSLGNAVYPEEMAGAGSGEIRDFRSRREKGGDVAVAALIDQGTSAAKRTNNFGVAVGMLNFTDAGSLTSAESVASSQSDRFSEVQILKETPVANGSRGHVIKSPTALGFGVNSEYWFPMKYSTAFFIPSLSRSWVADWPSELQRTKGRNYCP